MKKKTISLVLICFFIGFYQNVYGQGDTATTLLKEQIAFTNQITEFFNNICKLRNAGVDKTRMLAIFEKIIKNKNSKIDKLLYHFMKSIITRIYDIPKSSTEYELEIAILKISIIQESQQVGMDVTNSMGG